MEKFLLSRLFTTDKLNVINEQNIRISVFLSKFACFCKVNWFDKFISEIITLNIYNFFFRAVCFDFTSDGIKQVSFSKSGITVDEKRVIGIAWVCRNCKWCSVGKFIRWTDYKGIKCKFVVSIKNTFVKLFLFLIDFLWNSKADVNTRAKDAFKGIIKQGHIASCQGLAVKIARNH